MNNYVTDAPTAAWDFARTPRLTDLKSSSTRFDSGELNSAAGLAWNVSQTPAFFFVPSQLEGQVQYDVDGIVREVQPDGYWKLVGRHVKGRAASPGHYLNVRDDSRHIVGIVKHRYRILQNGDAPRFLDQLVETNDAMWEVAGALHGGAQVFWLMKLGSPIPLAGDRREAVQIHLLLTNSHDGSTSVTIAALASRPQSQATLAYPLPNANRLLKVRHTDSARGRTTEAHRALGLGRSYQHELVELATRMLDVPLGDDEFRAFVTEVVPTPKPRKQGKRIVNQRGITVAENTKGLITTVYYNNPPQENIRGTLWGAVQACQFVADHLATSRNTDDANADENRFKRLAAGLTVGAEAFAAAIRRIRS